MKKLTIYLIIGMIASSYSLLGVNPVSKPAEQEITKKQQRQEQRQQKKAAKWEKKMQKWEAKAAKKGKARGSSLWDDDTFRLGALIALGGLAIRLFAFLPFLGGIFNLIGTLVLLVGLGIMIWVLIDR